MVLTRRSWFKALFTVTASTAVLGVDGLLATLKKLTAGTVGGKVPALGKGQYIQFPLRASVIGDGWTVEHTFHTDPGVFYFLHRDGMYEFRPPPPTESELNRVFGVAFDPEKQPWL